MRVGRGTLALAAVALVALAGLGADLLDDRRIRLHTLVTLDPPPAPVVLRLDGATLSVTGALVREAGAGRVRLRAWAPTPTIRVAGAEPGGRLTVRLENVPLRMRLDATGPVEEERAGTTRTLRFAPAEARDLGFVAPVREVAFAVLGDTGDHPALPEALRVATSLGADFLLLAGDLVYEDKEIPAIEATLAASAIPVFVIRGNHDYRNQARIDFLRGLAPPYYAFRMGGATFVVLDNAGDYLPGFWQRSTQYRWWTHVLGEPRDGPLLVAMHKPPFDRRTGPRRAAMLDRPFARALMRDFTRAGVDAVFTGHVHDSHLWVEDGIPYVVSGEGLGSMGVEGSRMAWVRVRGRQVVIEQVPIWRRGTR